VKHLQRSVIEDIELREKRFGVEPELTAKIARRKFRIYEMPISYAGRNYEEGKKIGFKDALKAFYCIFRYWCSPANTLKIEKPTLQLGLHMNNPTEGLAYEETPRLGPTVPQPRLLPVQSYA
jgi:hypothetical protein